MPDLLEKVNNMFNNKMENKSENEKESQDEDKLNKEDDIKIEEDIEENFQTISMPKIHPKRNKQIKYEYKNRDNEQYDDKKN